MSFHKSRVARLEARQRRQQPPGSEHFTPVIRVPPEIPSKAWDAWLAEQPCACGCAHTVGGMPYTMSQHWGEPSRVGAIPHGGKGRSGHVCTPHNGIPERILTNAYGPRSPYLGDRGIQFQPVEED